MFAGALRGLLDWASIQMNQPHPESTEPVTTKIDEHQLGRSEVVGEIARPKKN
jgi:hypothetical protein